MAKLRPGTRVRIPWGLAAPKEGVILEVWGDPPHHVRVAVELGGPDNAEDVVTLLLSPSIVELPESA